MERLDEGTEWQNAWPYHLSGVDKTLPQNARHTIAKQLRGEQQEDGYSGIWNNVVLFILIVSICMEIVKMGRECSLSSFRFPPEGRDRDSTHVKLLCGQDLSGCSCSRC